MTRDKDQRRLEQIARDIDRIDRTLTAHGRDAFRTDIDVQDAVLGRLYRIADSSAELSEQLRARHPDIPWDQIHGFRVVMAHGYLDIILDAVQTILDADLPELRKAIAIEMGEDRGRDPGRSR